MATFMHEIPIYATLRIEAPDAATAREKVKALGEVHYTLHGDCGGDEIGPGVLLSPVATIFPGETDLTDYWEE